MYLNSFLACSNQEYQKRDRDERNTKREAKNHTYVPYEHLDRGDVLLSLSRTGSLRASPSPTLWFSSPIHRHAFPSPRIRRPLLPPLLPCFNRHDANPFFFPFGLLVIVVRHLVFSIRPPRHRCTPFCALPTRVDPISPSDHPGEPGIPAALPPPSLVVKAVAAARASMVI